MRLCSGGRRYIAQSTPVLPLPERPQWVSTPTYRISEVWVPCPPSAAPPGGETPQGISPIRGSETMSRTQKEAPLTPLPHRTSPWLSYLLPPFPRASTSVPIFPAPSGGSVPPPANRRRRTKTFVPGNGTKRPPSAVFHMPGRTSPPVTPSPQQPTSVSSSTPHAGTLMKSGAPD